MAKIQTLRNERNKSQIWLLILRILSISKSLMANEILEQIIKLPKKERISGPTFYKHMGKMVKKGLVFNPRRGVYQISPKGIEKRWKLEEKIGNKLAPKAKVVVPEITSATGQTSGGGGDYSGTAIWHSVNDKDDVKRGMRALQRTIIRYAPGFEGDLNITIRKKHHVNVGSVEVVPVRLLKDKETQTFPSPEDDDAPDEHNKASNSPPSNGSGWIPRRSKIYVWEDK